MAIFRLTGRHNKRAGNNRQHQFVSELIDWLSDDTGFELTCAQRRERAPIRQLEDATKVWLKYLNFVAGAVGYWLWFVSHAAKQNQTIQTRMSENYAE